MESQAVQDYLKAIYELEREHGKASTSALAETLRISPASATLMVKRLAELGLASHRPYQGVVLSKSGEKVALEVIRHHRLIERFLAEVLDVPWDEVHDEAERWEHVLSEELEGRMDAVLGYPTTDPHGSPIPRADGAVERPPGVPLAELVVGQTGQVAEVSDHDPELLRYLGGFGLYPGAPVVLLGLAPFEGPLTVRVGGDEHVLGREAARHVLVTVP